MSECFKTAKTSIFIVIILVCIFDIFAPKTISAELKNNLIIDVTPKQSYKETTPGHKVTFDIELENLGDERVRISCKILKLPNGWNADILPEVILGSKTLGEDSISTISFVVQSPNTFGYHDESAVFDISFTPISYLNPSLKGDEYMYTFNVRNRGWVLIGFDIVLIIIMLIAMLIVVFLIVKKRRK